MTPRDYLIAFVDDPHAVGREEWNTLLATQACPLPFMRHEYLCALHASGSATRQTGWAWSVLTLRRQGVLVGAVAAFQKTHSYGEYVFDWAWAEAYRRHGLRYYPKLLAAVPFTPVPGTRLLAVDEPARAALAGALRAEAESRKLSSAHVLFVDDSDRAALQAGGWMLREGVQFHWQNDPQRPLVDFADLLSRLQREKRKKIQQERRKVVEAGIGFRVLVGREIGEAEWDFFHRCYTLTYAAHHSTPYLTRAFFTAMASEMPEHWVMFVGERDGRPVAASLVAIDARHRVAWGRYWGSVEYVPCLHFEACYYQPLAWCIEQGYGRFEGGAQGEHKMARGLLPVRTFSAHWLRDERFASAVADFLAQEGQGIENYVDELRERNPFKEPAADA